MVKGSKLGLMVRNTRESGKVQKCMAEELRSGQMATHILETGSKASSMAVASMKNMEDLFMRETMRKAREKAKARSLGKMVRLTWVSGKKTT